jgi:hypothetical protein
MMISVLARLVRRETAAHTLSGRFIVLVLLAVVLVPVALYQGTQTYDARSEAVRGLRDQREAERSKATADPTGLQKEPGLRAIRTVVSSIILVRGTDTDLAWDAAPAGLESVPAPAGPPSREAAGALDLEFVIRVVLGLLALTLGGDLLARDRDSGTLHSLRCQPLSDLLIFLGKLLGGCAALGLAVLLVGATSLLLLRVTGRLLTPELSTAIAVLGAIGFLYMVAMYALGILAATMMRSYAALNAAAVSLWVIVALVTSPLIASLATLVEPVRSQSAVERDAAAAFDLRSRDLSDRLGDVFGRMAGPPTAWSQAESRADLRHEIESGWQEHVRGTRPPLRALHAAAFSSEAAQDRFASRLALLTPASAFTEAAAAIAGTGGAASRRWETAAQDYQTTLENQLFDDPPRIRIRVPESGRRALVGFNRHSTRPFRDLPDFRGANDDLRQHFRDAAPFVEGLAVFTALAIGVSFLGFRRSLARGN